jgi:ATP-binding cassette subfamily C protein
MMIAAAIIAARALQPLEGMIEGWRAIVHARGSYARILAAAEAMRNEPERLQLPRPLGALSVERVLYLPAGSKEPILNGLTFELKPGESLAIVGPSGSGKSTLARILVGCTLPTAGTVRLDGADLRNWDRRQFGECTGYLPQEVELFPGPIKQNICRMRDDLPDEAVYKAASLAGVHDLVCRLPQGYETELTADGGPLSGGEKQRIALARAFFGDPAMVVLDEPNSNLDAAGEQALIDSLQRAKKRGMTVAVVTQRPTLLGIVDKVMILKDGRTVAFGPPDKVLKPSVPPPAKLPSRSTARPSVDGNKRPRRKTRNAHDGSTAIKGPADVQ